MSETQKTKPSISDLSVTSLEADQSYFETRLAMLGTPKSAHQEAQKRLYELLSNHVTEMIERLQVSTGTEKKK
ncbi:MAG: hypothetical protein KZQ58_06525 [gamma proteobacterium symbiont of Bathyaustriella thionipta]|nr:hypothetical protein [gamma proteobacterium symbiont of Bathyaustriella thionipta]